MGWHCITVWECELKSQRREETLDSIAFTLNHIWLQDHGIKAKNYNPYPQPFDFPLRAVDLFDIPREGAMVAEDEVD